MKNKNSEYAREFAKNFILGLKFPETNFRKTAFDVYGTIDEELDGSSRMSKKLAVPYILQELRRNSSLAEKLNFPQIANLNPFKAVRYIEEHKQEFVEWLDKEYQDFTNSREEQDRRDITRIYRRSPSRTKSFE